jgi:alkylation response protein AidB-like acyl-CoA dehydrogenase
MSETLTTSTGLNFDLAPEQQLFRETMHDLVQREFPKDWCREVEAREDFPWDLWEKISENGLHGIGVAEEYGGQGGGIIEQVIVAEELSRTLAGLIWAWGVTAFAGVKALGHYGTEEQKQRILPGLCQGKAMFSISLTEPDGGTDVLGSMRTTAKKVDGGWLINGAKIWSTMAHVADMLLLIARSNDDVAKPSHGLTVFMCDAKAEGVKATKIPKIGMRSLGSCEVQLNDVFIPDENVIGEVDQGWRLLAETLNSERIMVSANCCGALQGILEDMVTYAQQRTAFGKPIGQFQAIQHMISDTYIGLETSRLATYRAAWLQSLGRPCGVESTAAKVFASEACFAAADRGMQILGGNAYAEEYDMQRYWRDMRLYRIAPISNEMARNFIGESLGLPRSF